MNCLAYALRFWEKHNNYKIWYNSDHCINLPEDIIISKFEPLENYSYKFINKSFDGLLDKYEQELLKKYYNIS